MFGNTSRAKETELALAKLLRAARITGWRRQQIIRFNFQRSTSNVKRSKFSVDQVMSRIRGRGSKDMFAIGGGR